jgi:hypothetical protein
MPPESSIPQAEIQGLRDRTRLRKALAEDRRGRGQRLHAYPARPRNWGKTTTAEHRPHRALRLLPPSGRDPTPSTAPAGLRRRDLLGGLIHEYDAA